MAGRPPTGQLTPRAQGAVAGRKDDAAIRRLLRENAMGGAIRLTFEREPDYFRGANLAGGNDRTILVSDAGNLVAVGRCTRRMCWVNGEPRTVGYLAELRLGQSARGQGRYLRRGYEFFRSIEQPDPAEVYFTAIASDNERARRVLESGMRGLPHYEYLAELTTVLVAVPRRSARRTTLQTSVATDSAIPDLLTLLNAQGRHTQLSTHWNEETLHALTKQELPLSRFHLVWRGDDLVACGALWDQRRFRQTVIRGYAPLLAATRPLLNAVARLFARPLLPAAGSVLPHAFLSPCACANEDPELLVALLESFFSEAAEAGLKYLTVAFPAQDPRIEFLRKNYHTRAWSSRLYQVIWPGETPLLLDRTFPILPEIALL